MFQIDIEALQIKSSKNEWHMCIVWLENSKSNVGNSDDHSRSKFVFCRKRVSFFHVLFCDAQVWSNCIRFYHFWNEIFLNHFQNGILSLSFHILFEFRIKFMVCVQTRIPSLSSKTLTPIPIVASANTHNVILEFVHEL